MRSLTWKPKLGGLMWFVDGVNPLKQTFSNAVFSGSIGAKKKTHMHYAHVFLVSMIVV